MDQANSQAFAERFLGDLNSAAVVLMTSIGHQVGLYDAMAGKPPATSEKIAAESRLNERYVREWLGSDGDRPRARPQPRRRHLLPPS